uniref:Apolipoprotein D n=1 Tax=Haematobia irritans TaxID=7368 RepID=A0A1L8EC70_HAEIR
MAIIITKVAKTLVSLTLALVIMHSSMVHGQVMSSERCPSNIEVMPCFDICQYMGNWYEYAKYPTYFETSGVCVKAEYWLKDDGSSVGIKNSLVNATNGSYQEIQGTGTVVSNGKLLINFPVSASYEVCSNYWVLDTDYTTYSVVYSCQNLENGQGSSTSLWILTRDHLPLLSSIEKAATVIRKNGLSLDPLFFTNQLDCSN